jgi:phosphoglucosamine mutase
MMNQRGWKLGGENSGHIICADVTTTGDGIVSALKVLFASVTSQTSIHDLKKGMSKFPQIMQNVRTAQKINLEALPAVQSAVKSVEDKLAGRGRVLLRPSGTEPVVRVMVEGEDDSLVRSLCGELAHVVQRAVG